MLTKWQAAEAFDDQPYKVVSSGGVGSKMFVRCLYPDGDRATWRRNHIHSRNPRQFRRSGCTFLYLFGDPRNAVLSLFNRRERRHDRHGFTPAPSHRLAIPTPKFVAQHLRNIGAERPGVDDCMDIEAFVANVMTSDPLRLEHHFDQWLRASKFLSTIFVRYETLWRNREAVCDLLNIPYGNFPDFVERQSVWQNQSEFVRTRLGELYGSFAERLESYPDIFRIEGNRAVALTKGPKLFHLPKGKGMMAHLNTLLNGLKRHEDGDIDAFELDDREFLYGSWGDFFCAPPFDVKVSDRRNVLPRYGAEFVQPRRSIHPREARGLKSYRRGKVGRGHILLPPANRREAHRLIAKYLHLNDRLREMIDREIADYRISEKLSVHIRGAGRMDGGVAWMLWKMGIRGVPYELYFQAIDKYLSKRDVGIFVFSDSMDVINEVSKRYGQHVEHRRESLLAFEGEPHKDDRITDKTKLGTDVIVESYLMANSQYLIHGNSNVTNWVLCLNPDLQSYDIFHRFYEQDDSRSSGSSRA